MQIPEVRLITDPEGVVPPYAVVRHPEGYWYGVLGSPRTRLTDEDVKDAIPLQPGPGAVVDVRFTGDRLTDHSLCDVDINGNVATRRVSTFVAGAFIVATAAHREGEPIMVRATCKEGGPVELTRPKLAAVPTRKS